MELFLWTFGTGVLSALATGLGAFVVLLVRQRTDRVVAFMNAAAAGMMISASVFSLSEKGLQMDQGGVTPWLVIAGLLLGAAFFWGLADRVGHAADARKGGLSGRSFLLFVALFVHSAPEGVAIGVGFASGDFGFGLMMAAAISLHNVPEGIAMSLPLRAEGASFWKCFWMSVATSIPQPLLAVPSAFALVYVEPLLPLGLGFAGGAMFYISVVDLIPEALEHGSRTLVAWGVMVGLTGMLALATLLPAL